MANPQDPGTFDFWITDRIMFKTGVPKSGNTGDFEKWKTDRIYWEDYVEAAAAVVVNVPKISMRHPMRNPILRL